VRIPPEYVGKYAVFLLTNMEDDERGKTPDTEVTMEDNRVSSNQTSDNMVTGAYSKAKVNAPEGLKRHQTYYDSESTPPKQRSIANTLVSACYTETN